MTAPAPQLERYARTGTPAPPRGAPTGTRERGSAASARERGSAGTATRERGAAAAAVARAIATPARAYPDVVPSPREAYAPAPVRPRRAPARPRPARTPTPAPTRRPVAPRPTAPPRETLTTVRTRRARSRWPFVVLLLTLMIGGLVGLLVLNTVLAQGAFRLKDLQTTSAQLGDSEQALTRQADQLSDPATLAARATALGLRPGGVPQFIRAGTPLPRGAVVIHGPHGDVVVVPPSTSSPVRSSPVRSSPVRH